MRAVSCITQLNNPIITPDDRVERLDAHILKRREETLLSATIDNWVSQCKSSPALNLHHFVLFGKAEWDPQP